MEKLTLTVAICTALLTHPVLAQDDITPVPIPVDPALIDISGVWVFSSSNHTVSGSCPVGTPMVGTLSIAKEEGAVSLQLLSGAMCNPVSMCSYSGEILESSILVSNGDEVDDEEGEVFNALNLFFYSEAKGAGNASSRYIHPKGFECHWEYSLKLSRPKQEQN